MTDDELTEAIAHTRTELRGALSGYARGLTRVLAAAEAHLRSQQPETDDQRAERELGAWLVAHPGWTHAQEKPIGTHPWVFKLCKSSGGPRGFFRGTGQTRSAAILDALREDFDGAVAGLVLAKARDAEGGKS